MSITQGTDIFKQSKGVAPDKRRTAAGKGSASAKPRPRRRKVQGVRMQGNTRVNLKAPKKRRPEVSLYNTHININPKAVARSIYKRRLAYYQNAKKECTGAGAERRDTKKGLLTRAPRHERVIKLKQKEAAENQTQERDPQPFNDNRICNEHNTLFLIVGAVGSALRSQRLEKEKGEARDYWQLHRQGKTAKARSDFTRLVEIRKDREEAREKRMARAEAKATEIEAMKKARMERRFMPRTLAKKRVCANGVSGRTAADRAVNNGLVDK